MKSIAGIYTSLSVAAAALVVIIIIFFGHDGEKLSFAERLAFGAVFTSSCVLGASLTARPGWLRRLGHGGAPAKSDRAAPGRKIAGHHPACGQFLSHTVKIAGKTYCSGCVGLAIGSAGTAVAAVVTVIMSDVVQVYAYFIFAGIGLSLVALALAEVKMDGRNKAMHMTLSALLPAGFFLVSYAMLVLTGNIFIGFAGIILSALWMDTRVQLSIYRHDGICGKCENKCTQDSFQA